MPIGAERYLASVLPPSHREALLTAVDELVDEFFEDVAALLTDDDFADTTMASYLPRRHLPRYTPLFAKQFLVCLLAVAWKLHAPGVYRLACIAEELALHALIQVAELLLEADGQRAEFAAFRDVAYEDQDFALLFDPARDGIEASEAGRRMGLANLRFENWFRPFREEEPVHPYVLASDGPDLIDNPDGQGA